MSGGVIKVVLTLDDNDFQIRTERAGQSLETFRGRVARARRDMRDMEGGLISLGRRFKDIVFGISLARFAFQDFQDIFLAFPVAVARAGGEIERLHALMRGLSKETGTAKREIEALNSTQFIFDFARTSPFELKSVTDMFVKLKTAGIDPTNGSMLALTNSLAKFGATEDLAHRASIAIQQMAGKGVVSMEELRQQLGEAVPNAIQMMAASMGMSVAELTKIVSKGAVGAEVAIKKMLVAMSVDAAGAAAELKKTLPGMLATLKTEWELFKIAAAGGQDGFMQIVKDQLALLTEFFRSDEGKQFAATIGQGLKSMARGIVEVKDLLISLWPIIKLIGTGLLAWGGGRVIASLASSISGLMSRANEAANNAMQATAQIQRDKIRGIQDEIRANEELTARRRIDAAEAIKRVRVERQAKIEAAREEMRLAAERSARLSAQAAELTRQRQEQFRVLKDAQASMNNAERNAYLGGAQGQIQALARYKDAVEQKIKALNESIIATRREADAAKFGAANSVEAAKAKIAMIEADRTYRQGAAATLAVMRSTDAQMQATNAALAAKIANLNRASVGWRAMGTAIAGFGRTLLASLGWMAAFAVALEGLAWLYDKVAGAANRAKDAEAARERAKRGTADKFTLDNLKAQEQAILSELDGAESRRDIARAENSRRPDAVFQAEIRAAEAEIARKSVELANIRDRIAEAAATVTRTDTDALVRDMVEKIRKDAEAFAATSDIGKTAREALNAQIEAGKNKDKDPKAFEAANKRFVDSTVAMLRGQSESLKTAFDRELPEVQKRGEEAVAKFTSEYLQQRKGIEDQIQNLLAPNDIRPTGPANPFGKGNTQRESPLISMVQQARADFEVAKRDLALLNSEVADYKANAQNAELFNLLADLAAGKFDFGTAKKPVEPAKAIRATLVNDFAAALDEGNTSALKFLDSIQGLDVVVTGTNQTVRQLMRTIVENASATKNAEERAKLLSNIKQKQLAVIEDLKNSTEEYSTTIAFLPAGVQSLSRELAKLSDDAARAGMSMDEFNRKRNELLGQRLQADLQRESVDFRKQVEQAELGSIVNVREREARAHQLRMAEITAEHSARKTLAQEIGANQETLAVLDQTFNQKRLVEVARFSQAYKSEIDRVADAWSDLGGNVERMLSSQSQKWLDAFVDFVGGAKISFSDLIGSMLKDMLRIQLQKMIAPVLQTGANTAVTAVTGLLNGGTSSAAAADPNAASAAGPLQAVGEAAQVASDKMTELSIGGLAQMALGLVKSIFLNETESAVTATKIASETFLSAQLNVTASSLLNLALAADQAAGALWSQAGTSILGFANGGIMTPNGSVGDLTKGMFNPNKATTSLKFYSKGGIANRPQVAVFGEGRMNEAYVPLPDGRTIPVTLTGGGGGGATNVIVNVINKTGEKVNAERATPRFDGKQMILDVVLTAAASPGPFRDGMRGSLGAR